MNYMHHCDSPLGGITMTSDGTHLTGLLFDDEKYFDSTFRDQYQEGDLPVFAEADRWLEMYFSWCARRAHVLTGESPESAR